MNIPAVRPSERPSAALFEPMEAGWLQTSRGALFACYHVPSGPVRDSAVLLCDPYGSERMNLHLTYRALAQRFAAEGFHTLRVDYAATCDSSGYPRGTAQVSTSLANLEAAADWLRERSGCARIVAFGAGLGGTLATKLAAQRSDVDGLALWSPLPTGRAYLRASAALDALGELNPKGLLPSDVEPGDVEATGFRVSAATAAELSALDLRKLQGPLAAQIAVFGGMRPGDALYEALRRGSERLQLITTEELDIEALQRTGTRPPAAVVDAITSWLAAAYPALHDDVRESVRVSRSSLGPAASPAAAAAPYDWTLAAEVVVAAPDGTEVREELVRFGPERQMLGIVTRPLAAFDALRPAVVLINGGLNHRSGINRNYTEWARQLAAGGWLVLRFDIRGLGDSAPKNPDELGLLYRDETVEDVRTALDLLAVRYGANNSVLAGLCAGAYQSLHTARLDARVTGLVMLNPLRFRSPTEEPQGKAVPEARTRTLTQYAQAMLHPAVWQRIASGRVDVRGISRAMATRALHRVEGRARKLTARLLGGAPTAASWLASTFTELTSRGCNVLLVLDENDPIVATVEDQLAQDLDRLVLSGRFALERIDGADHIFRPLFAQERVYRLIESRLLAWSSRPRNSRPPPR